MPLLALQNATYEYIKAHDSFTAYTVLARQPFNCNLILNTMTQSQLGFNILISPPIPNSIQPGVSGPVYTSLNLHIHLIHNVFSTFGEVSLIDTAHKLSQALHLWVPPIDAWKSALQLIPKDPWQVLEHFPKKNYNVLRLEFFTSVKATRPQIA